MSVRYSLATGAALTFDPGLPPHYKGPVLQGCSASHTLQEFGFIVVQEVHTTQFTFRHVTINRSTPTRIICDYHYKPVVFTRIALHTPVYEMTKGTGVCEMPPYHFATFIGSSWTTLIHAAAPGETVFIEISWLPSLVADHLQQQSALVKVLENSIPGVADRVSWPPGMVNPHMRQLLNELDLDDKPTGRYVTAQMKEFFKVMLREMTHDYRVRMGIAEKDHDTILAVQKLIEEDLDTQYDTPQLAKLVGMNESKLKKLYRKLFGITIEESRKYRICIRMRNELLLKNTPLKVLCEQTGYAKGSVLIKSCRRLIACRPGELRRDKWNTEM